MVFGATLLRPKLREICKIRVKKAICGKSWECWPWQVGNHGNQRNAPQLLLHLPVAHFLAFQSTGKRIQYGPPDHSRLWESKTFKKHFNWINYTCNFQIVGRVKYRYFKWIAVIEGHKIKTQCQIVCTMQFQRVSKILTPRRMLQKTWLIAQINLWTNSFQNL